LINDEKKSYKYFLKQNCLLIAALLEKKLEQIYIYLYMVCDTEVSCWCLLHAGTGGVHSQSINFCH